MLANQLMKLPLLVLLWNGFHLVNGHIYCKTDFILNNCVFAGILTNETSLYFQPMSLNQHPGDVSTVVVKKSKIPLLTNELCNVFPNLTGLYLTECSLKQFQDGALSSCANLSLFHVNYNDITEIRANLFLNRTTITEIDFSYNKLTYVDVEAFEPTKNLTKLYLHNNFLVFFDFRTMPSLRYLTEMRLDGNNLLDVDEKVVFEKLSNLNSFEINANLLDCRNVKLMIETFKDKRVAFIKRYRSYRERPQSFLVQQEEGIQCLNRTEHVKAFAHYINQMQVATNSVSCLEKTVPEAEKQFHDHVIIIQFVSAILILCCVSMMIWHIFYWKSIVNSLFYDTGDYYYCNYFPANVQKVGK